jgi:hypothetical protein
MATWTQSGEVFPRHFRQKWTYGLRRTSDRLVGCHRRSRRRASRACKSYWGRLSLVRAEFVHLLVPTDPIVPSPWSGTKCSSVPLLAEMPSTAGTQGLTTRDWRWRSLWAVRAALRKPRGAPERHSALPRTTQERTVHVSFVSVRGLLVVSDRRTGTGQHVDHLLLPQLH